MKELDFSSLENYNRHDLVQGILGALVFTESSKLKKFTIQNLDIGRAQAYLKSLKVFEDYIE